MLPIGLGPAVAANDAGWIVVGGGHDPDIGTDSGSIALWQVTDGRGSDSLVEFHATIAHPRGGIHTAFGSAVALDRVGETLCVGAPHESGDGDWPENFQMGRVYLYSSLDRSLDRSKGCDGSRSATSLANVHPQWMLEQSIASTSPMVGAHFGATLAADGRRVVVGSPAHNGRGVAAGFAEVFVHTSEGWKSDGELVPPITASGMRFATSVALRGDLALIGSPNFTGSLMGDGCADLFQRTKEGWTHIARLVSPTPQFAGWFGMSVAIGNGSIAADAIAADFIAAGAPGETAQAQPPASGRFPERAGVVHLFSPVDGSTGNGWIAIDAITSPSPWCEESLNRPEAFGMSLAMAQGAIVVGASEACAQREGGGGDSMIEGVGVAYLFSRRGSTWRIGSRLTAPNAPAEVHDGYCVALGSAPPSTQPPAPRPTPPSTNGEPFIVVGRLGNPDHGVGPGEANVYGPTAPTQPAIDSASR
ncbi:MAG: hypothetical protein EXS15_08560 [Phycisphaerales bacterium]|nr:hypothetical protein [Phycisphaerales bacterium]